MTRTTPCHTYIGSATTLLIKLPGTLHMPGNKIYEETKEQGLLVW